MKTDPSFTPIPESEPKDLGFGAVVARASKERLLNRDGSFNVKRDGLPFGASLSLYHALLTMSWPRFLGAVVAFYLAVNAAFGAIYAALGPDALDCADPSLGTGFLRGFFFSVETFSTVGYGQISPRGLPANVVITIEIVCGLLSLTLATGMLFARIARPTASIIFSRSAVIAPYQDITAFEFRIANARKNQILDFQATVILSWLESGARRFRPLDLERRSVAFFPLSWTIVHPINETSPLHGATEASLRASDAEFMVLLTGIDETFAQNVHARSSYKSDELVWNAKFANILQLPADGQSITIDVAQIHEIEPVASAG
jgi:inward rectifier potassium channel